MLFGGFRRGFSEASRIDGLFLPTLNMNSDAKELHETYIFYNVYFTFCYVSDRRILYRDPIMIYFLSGCCSSPFLSRNGHYIMIIPIDSKSIDIEYTTASRDICLLTKPGVSVAHSVRRPVSGCGISSFGLLQMHSGKGISGYS